MALEAAGIKAWVSDESGGTIYGVGIGARLQVRRTDAEAAAELLGTTASSLDLPPELAEPPCPACGSRNVAPEAWVAEAGATDMGISQRRKWHYVCTDCREAWPV
jgi:hypothetical protein